MDESAGDARVETLSATGHEHVAATHASTFEVTTDDFLTPAGDCIVGIEADRAPTGFDPDFVAACQDPDARIETTLIVGAREQTVVGRGDPDLTFESDRSAVWRTSDYVDERTVAVGCDAAAADLPRGMIEELAAGSPVTVRIGVELGD